MSKLISGYADVKSLEIATPYRTLRRCIAVFFVNSKKMRPKCSPVVFNLLIYRITVPTAAWRFRKYQFIKKKKKTVETIRDLDGSAVLLKCSEFFFYFNFTIVKNKNQPVRIGTYLDYRNGRTPLWTGCCYVFSR